MKVAVQTISWGYRPNVSEMLRQAEALGYRGVEVAQHPDELGTADDFYGLIAKYNLTFIGLSGGSLLEKIEFTTRYAMVDLRTRFKSHDLAVTGSKWEQSVPYLYLDEWEGARTLAALAGNTLALHPHMFKTFQTAHDALLMLDRHPDLWFLPDTAHLTVAGENVVEVLRQTYNRLAAVHLNDWTAEYGRAYHFYSRGFVELGCGDVNLETAVRFLRDRGFRRWLVVEQDTSGDPVASAAHSRQWLRDNCAV
jgi:inosose dehydratase